MCFALVINKAGAVKKLWDHVFLTYTSEIMAVFICDLFDGDIVETRRTGFFLTSVRYIQTHWTIYRDYSFGLLR